MTKINPLLLISIGRVTKNHSVNSVIMYGPNP